MISSAGVGGREGRITVVTDGSLLVVSSCANVSHLLGQTLTLSFSPLPFPSQHSGRLIILPKKSWHVWNQDNREKVLRDERLHREEQERQAEQQRYVGSGAGREGKGGEAL